MSTAEPASKRTSERCEQMSERANGRASGLILRSGFLVDLAHSAMGAKTGMEGDHDENNEKS